MQIGTKRGMISLFTTGLRAYLTALVGHDGQWMHPERRRVNLLPDERPNGRAHARALLLGPSKTLTVLDGRLQLGRWQSIFLAELDGPRERTISLTIMGHRRISD